MPSCDHQWLCWQCHGGLRPGCGLLKAAEASPLARLVKITQQMLDAMYTFDPSGLDEFHPDTTHNPESGATRSASV